jgi:hypothetical protein
MGSAVLKDYMPSFQAQYQPHPGFMNIPDSGYLPNDGFGMDDYSLSDHQGVIEEFRQAAMEIAGINHRDVKYEDSLMTQEMFQELMDELREQNTDPLSPTPDMNETTSPILEDQMPNEENDIAPNLRDTMLDIQMAVTQAEAESLTAWNPEPMDFGPAVPQGFFEPHDEMLDPTLEEVVDVEQLSMDMSAIRDYQDSMTVQVALEDQMYGTAEDMNPMQPDMLDNDMMPQDMADEPMSDEMMDPSMLPGPWGPMPGPGGP